MKILITGGTGFIGAHLAKFCSDKGNIVHMCDNNFRGKKDDFILNILSNDKVEYLKKDLTRLEEVKSLDTDYDIVFHFAAINGTENFYKIPYSVFEVSLKSTMYLLEHLGNKCKIVFSSSSEVYAGTIKGNQSLVPTAEEVVCTIDDVMNERFSYGGSKLACEIMLNSYDKQYSIDYQIIRYHNIYGPRMGTKHVMPQFIKRAKDGESPFKIFGSDQTRAFCYIDDAVEATYNLALENTKGLFHIGNDQEEVEIFEVAKIVTEYYSKHNEYDIKEAPNGSVPRRCPNIQKLKNTIDYSPKISLHEGLTKTIKWYDKWYQTNIDLDGAL
tara:strand:- start:790 stop:1773 length:984 start_codon:yes stop_codon:yes gene_type:complete